MFVHNGEIYLFIHSIFNTYQYNITVLVTIGGVLNIGDGVNLPQFNGHFYSESKVSPGSLPMTTSGKQGQTK